MFPLAIPLLRVGFGQPGPDSFPDRECVMWVAAVSVAGCNWDVSLNEQFDITHVFQNKLSLDL